MSIHREARKLKIIVVIPAKNEGESIAEVINELKEVNREHEFGDLEVLVVNDSTDDTDKVVIGLGESVIRGDGTGLGAAMYMGMKEAVRRGADVIVSIDADGQFDPLELPRVITPILESSADLVLGSRFLDHGVEYKMPLINKIGNSVLSWMVRKASGFQVTDGQTGYRAMTREVAEKFEMIGTHTYVQETIIDAAEKHFRILEVPARFRLRKHGSSKVVSSVKRYAIWTFPVLVLRAGLHMMFFTAIGIIMVLIGLGYGIFVFYEESFIISNIFDRLPALLLVVLLITLGFQIFFIGMVLQMLVRIKHKVDHLDMRR